MGQHRLVRQCAGCAGPGPHGTTDHLGRLVGRLIEQLGCQCGGRRITWHFAMFHGWQRTGNLAHVRRTQAPERPSGFVVTSRLHPGGPVPGWRHTHVFRRVFRRWPAELVHGIIVRHSLGPMDGDRVAGGDGDRATGTVSAAVGPEGVVAKSLQHGVGFVAVTGDCHDVAGTTEPAQSVCLHLAAIDPDRSQGRNTVDCCGHVTGFCDHRMDDQSGPDRATAQYAQVGPDSVFSSVAGGDFAAASAGFGRGRHALQPGPIAWERAALSYALHTHPGIASIIQTRRACCQRQRNVAQEAGACRA